MSEIHGQPSAANFPENKGVSGAQGQPAQPSKLPEDNKTQAVGKNIWDSNSTNDGKGDISSSDAEKYGETQEGLLKKIMQEVDKRLDEFKNNNQAPSAKDIKSLRDSLNSTASGGLEKSATKTSLGPDPQLKDTTVKQQANPVPDVKQGEWKKTKPQPQVQSDLRRKEIKEETPAVRQEELIKPSRKERFRSAVSNFFKSFKRDSKTESSGEVKTTSARQKENVDSNFKIWRLSTLLSKFSPEKGDTIRSALQRRKDENANDG